MLNIQIPLYYSNRTYVFSEESSKVGKILRYQEQNLPDHLSWRIPKGAQIIALTSKVAQIPAQMRAVAQL